MVGLFFCFFIVLIQSFDVIALKLFAAIQINITLGKKPQELIALRYEDPHCYIC